jgi:Zn-dependent protease with chaperone function
MEDPSPSSVKHRQSDQPGQEPQPQQQPEHSTPPETVLRALDGAVNPVKRPPLYFLGLLIVTAAMVLLPLIYLALIAAVGYLLFLHATENTSIFASDTNFRVILIGYFGPLAVGVIVLLFMVKPLFARPPNRPEPHTVDPETQSLLFFYVERLSKLLGAPLPRRIDLDCEVNASASFRRGGASMIGSDLVLTIGLPLVDGMSLRQLTGVLAHELGHFAQGGGMRLSYIIRRVSHWFARVVYERDGFDITLEDTSREGGSILLLVIGWAARACVWLTRRILWVLMAVGNVISCMLLRQMEYDADRYETRIAGSEQFEKTARRLIMLGVGQQIAMNDLGTFWQEKKLPDNFPRLVTVNAEMLDDESREKIWADRVAAKTGWFDTHPSDADRIKNALQENEAGLIQLDLPAEELFDNYDAVTSTVTREAYQNMLEIPVSAENLIPTRQLLDEQKKSAEIMVAFQRFFQGRATVDTPVFLSVGRIDAHADYDELKRSVESARSKIRQAPPEDLDSHREQLRERLYRSLQLLHSPHVQAAAQVAGEELALEIVGQRVEFLCRLERQFGKVEKLRNDFETMMSHLQEYEERKEDPKFQKEAVKLVSNCRMNLRAVTEALSGIAYPYEHADGDVNCGQFAVRVIPQGEDITGIIEISEDCLNRLYRLYFRVLSDLATVAERAEKLAGFSELPIPAEEDD